MKGAIGAMRMAAARSSSTTRLRERMSAAVCSSGAGARPDEVRVEAPNGHRRRRPAHRRPHGCHRPGAASAPSVTVWWPAASSSAPCSAWRRATTVGPPITSGGGNATRRITRPSTRLTSPSVGAHPRASTTSATPRSPSARMAFGATSSPNPSSRAEDVRSKTLTSQPAWGSAMAAESPPIPAPTMGAVGVTSANREAGGSGRRYGDREDWRAVRDEFRNWLAHPERA